VTASGKGSKSNEIRQAIDGIRSSDLEEMLFHTKILASQVIPEQKIVGIKDDNADNSSCKKRPRERFCLMLSNGMLVFHTIAKF
jgi:hypothetical protein